MHIYVSQCHCEITSSIFPLLYLVSEKFLSGHASIETRGRDGESSKKGWGKSRWGKKLGGGSRTKEN